MYTLAGEILGLSKPLFIVVVAIIVLFGLAFLYIFMGIVFADENNAKIVMTRKKKMYVVNKKTKITVPFFDKVVAKISLLESTFQNKKPTAVATLNGDSYQIIYSLIYKVVDPIKFYSFTKDFQVMFETKVSNGLIEYYSSKDITKGNDLYSLDKNEVLASINNKTQEMGIETSDIVLILVAKI